MVGPVKRAGGLVVDRLPDGRYVHTFRQSVVGELDTCPERGRAAMAGEIPPDESDAAALGTACHAGFEAAARSLLAGDPLTLPAIEEIAQDEFTRVTQQPWFRWAKYSEESCRAHISRVVELFYDELYHQLDPIVVEWGFGPLVVHEDESRVIQIAGTVDLHDAGFGPCDYKTTEHGRTYRRGFGGDAWQLDRWAIQPTVYVEALRQAGHVDPEGPWRFTYFGFELGKEPALHVTSVWRTPADLRWMRDKLVSYAVLAEAGIPVWPKQDNHALCSPKWCLHWGNCKGAHYGDWWPLRGSDDLDTVRSAVGMVGA